MTLGGVCGGIVVLVVLGLAVALVRKFGEVP